MRVRVERAARTTLTRVAMFRDLSREERESCSAGDTSQRRLFNTSGFATLIGAPAA
jgi:hypothetical protein